MIPLRVAVVYWARTKLGTDEIRKSKGSIDRGLFEEGITAPEKATSQGQCGVFRHYIPQR
jgi:hypothetical protein